MPPSRPPALDAIDVKILATLQRDGRMTIQKLADVVGLSPRPCLERVRRLEAAKIISAYQAVIDVMRLSKPITVFAEVALDSHARQEAAERHLLALDEVVECWEISGTFDYLLRFACADLSAYESLTADLIGDKRLGIARIVSHIALRPVRRFSGYPRALLAPTSAQSRRAGKR